MSAEDGEEVAAGDRLLGGGGSVAEAGRDGACALVPVKRAALQRAALTDERAGVVEIEREVPESLVARLAPQEHDAVLIAHRQTPQEQRVGDREHGGGEADPERE